MTIKSRSLINRRNDMILIRAAEDQALELFQTATVLIAESKKDEAKALLTKAIWALGEYRSPLKLDLMDLKNSL